MLESKQQQIDKMYAERALQKEAEVAARVEQKKEDNTVAKETYKSLQTVAAAFRIEPANNLEEMVNLAKLLESVVQGNHNIAAVNSLQCLAMFEEAMRLEDHYLKTRHELQGSVHTLGNALAQGGLGKTRDGSWAKVYTKQDEVGQVTVTTKKKLFPNNK